jgi:predicted adenylyl cyclase CyaB
MAHINIEIKARCRDPLSIERILKAQGARFVGLDHQVDTYFKVRHGRLKLREGSIEKTLIHYNRTDQSGPKQSDVTLLETREDATDLKTILSLANGILAVVDKQRQIYFIENVKFHLDQVVGLGSFIEIEAIDKQDAQNARADEPNGLTLEELSAQCQYYMDLFHITEKDLMQHSYSDMILDKRFELNLNEDFDFDL